MSSAVQYNGTDEGTGGDSLTQDLNIYYEVREGVKKKEKKKKKARL